MYHLVFIFLLLFSFLELFYSFKKRMIYIIYALLMTMLVLRYGQGSDYFNYIYLINTESQAFNYFLKYAQISFINKEVGFSFISYIWIVFFRFAPEAMIALMSAMSFYWFSMFAIKYSSKPIISLFFFYCVFFLIYPFSAVRQAFCVGFFLHYMIVPLFRRNYLRYFLLVLFLTTFHYSSIILVTLPFLKFPLFNFLDKRKFIYYCIISILIGLVFERIYYILFSNSAILMDKLSSYGDDGIDFISLLFRFMLIVLVFPLKEYYLKNKIKLMFLNIYFFSFIIYLLFIFSSIISSRLSIFMRYFEFILLADIVCFQVLKNRQFKKLNMNYYFFVTIMCTIMYIKNIDSFIVQGEYVTGINVLNYEYISIFEKERIFEIREVPKYYNDYIN